jgi:hypothetical protein
MTPNSVKFQTYDLGRSPIASVCLEGCSRRRGFSRENKPPDSDDYEWRLQPEVRSRRQSRLTLPRADHRIIIEKNMGRPMFRP